MRAKPHGGWVASIVGGWERLDQRMVQFMTAYGITLMRVSLAVVFIWFGMLKLIGASPVADLVARTVYWFEPGPFVKFLGVWETVVGLGLLLRMALRMILFLFWLQLAGTFLVLVLRPDIAFQAGNLFLLTTEGEFVVKNLVLITGGLVVGGTLRRDAASPRTRARR